MPGTDFYRAMATVKYIRDELMHERDAHDAMKLCFEKIHKSLDMYQGHFINRLRFHLNRHHTEYLRKVRVMKKERNEMREEESTNTTSSGRRSMRVAAAQDLANEVETLKLQLRRKDLEIERLAMLLDDKIEPPIVVTRATEPIRKYTREEKMMNPFLPSSDEEDLYVQITKADDSTTEPK
jgi:hypothetical protein